MPAEPVRISRLTGPFTFNVRSNRPSAGAPAYTSQPALANTARATRKPSSIRAPFMTSPHTTVLRLTRGRVNSRHLYERPAAPVSIEENRHAAGRLHIDPCAAPDDGEKGRFQGCGAENALRGSRRRVPLVPQCRWR